MKEILSFEEWIKKHMGIADKERIEELKQLQKNKDAYEVYMSDVKKMLSKEYPKSTAYVESHLVKPSRFCNMCGRHILKSDLEQYEYQCMYCDEDLFGIETRKKMDMNGNEIDEEISTFDYCNLIIQVSDILLLDEEKDLDKSNNTVFNLELPENDIPEFVGQIIDLFEDFLDEKGVILPNQERDEDHSLTPEESANIYGEDYFFLENKIKDTIINWASVNIDKSSQTKVEAHKHIIESKVKTIDDVVRRLNDGLDRTDEELEKCKKWLLEYKAANKMSLEELDDMCFSDSLWVFDNIFR